MRQDGVERPDRLGRGTSPGALIGTYSVRGLELEPLPRDPNLGGSSSKSPESGKSSVGLGGDYLVEWDL